jgi:hypothetical protein
MARAALARLRAAWCVLRDGAGDTISPLAAAEAAIRRGAEDIGAQDARRAAGQAYSPRLAVRVRLKTGCSADLEACETGLPGLVATRWHKVWCLTHRSSGLGICAERHWPSAEDVAADAERCLSRFDWTRPVEEICRDRAAAEAARRLAGEGGGKR